MRVELLTKPEMLNKVTSGIGKAGGDIGGIDIVGIEKGTIIRDMGNMELRQIMGLAVAFAVIGLIVYRSIPYHGGGNHNFKTASIQNSVQGGWKCFGNVKKLRRGK